ncbi:uncharacterized protein C6G9.01c [Malania oleifera]|uniref:uncharacterized protein C6G9.01c n=1 Tax=Malania oleifera TaxID=397392 RepID=UPI0025AE17E9|nr:uncharacterized protein C6G9.01c [Malania oleifera]
MTGKSSSKMLTPPQEYPPVEQEKLSLTPKKPRNEIEEIFSSGKRKKAERGKDQKLVEDASKKPKKMKKKMKSKGVKDQGLSDPPSRPRKRTGDGLAVYTEEELGIGKADAGGTPLCPFDCSCCF